MSAASNSSIFTGLSKRLLFTWFLAFGCSKFLAVSHACENEPKHQTLSWKQGFKEGVLTGALTGVLLNPLDQYKIRSQALGSGAGEGLRAVMNAPFRGVRISLLHGVSSNLLIFGTRPGFTALSQHYLTDDDLTAVSTGGAMAGVFRSFVNAPLGTLRTRQYTGLKRKTLSEIYQDMPQGQKARILLRGGPACALENAAIWGGYFAMTEAAKHSSEDNSLLTRIGLGGPAFLVTNALGYPFDTVSGVQRRSDHPKNMLETGKDILRQRGIQGFYKGFVTGVALRSFLSGILISGVLTLSGSENDGIE